MRTPETPHADHWQTPGWYLRLGLLFLLAVTLWPRLYTRRSFPFEDERLGVALLLALFLAAALDATRPGSAHLPAPARALVALLLLALQVAATPWGALAAPDAFNWLRTLTYILCFGYGPGLRWLALTGYRLLSRGRVTPRVARG